MKHSGLILKQNNAIVYTLTYGIFFQTHKMWQNCVSRNRFAKWIFYSYKMIGNKKCKKSKIRKDRKCSIFPAWHYHGDAFEETTMNVAAWPHTEAVKFREIMLYRRRKTVISNPWVKIVRFHLIPSTSITAMLFHVLLNCKS